MADNLVMRLDAKAAIAELKVLAAKDMRKIVRSSLRAASKPLLKMAVSLAPVLNPGTNKNRVAGVLKRSLKLITSKKEKGNKGFVGLYIAAKQKGRSFRGRNDPLDPFYYRFVELGHRIGKRKGKLTKYERATFVGGYVAGRFYLKRAYAANATALPTTFDAEVGKRLAAFQAGGRLR